MRVLILGLGVIGTTYGYAFQKAGHDVENFIRENKKAVTPKTLKVDLLDGRFSSKGENVSGEYSVSVSEPGREYDFIIVRVPSGKLAEAIITLKENHIKGTLLLFCNFWNNRTEIEQIVKGYSYIIGFPTAGGRMNGDKLECVLFDNIKLETKEKAGIKTYDKLTELLNSANIKTETAYDMIEWIWIHMAINAGVTSTAAKDGVVENPYLLATQLMDNSKALSEAVLTIRETVKIVKARGVDLKKYNNELLPYKVPSWLAGIIMKKMFRDNELTRKIMLLHSDIDDIVYSCSCVYETGKTLGVKTPLFSEKYERIAETIAGR
jgi:2-dehydropantoate 2-reductase